MLEIIKDDIIHDLPSHRITRRTIRVRMTDSSPIEERKYLVHKAPDDLNETYYPDGTLLCIIHDLEWARITQTTVTLRLVGEMDPIKGRSDNVFVKGRVSRSTGDMKIALFIPSGSDHEEPIDFTRVSCVHSADGGSLPIDRFDR